MLSIGQQRYLQQINQNTANGPLDEILGGPSNIRSALVTYGWTQDRPRGPFTHPHHLNQEIHTDPQTSNDWEHHDYENKEEAAVTRGSSTNDLIKHLQHISSETSKKQADGRQPKPTNVWVQPHDRFGPKHDSDLGEGYKGPQGLRSVLSYHGWKSDHDSSEELGGTAYTHYKHPNQAIIADPQGSDDWEHHNYNHKGDTYVNGGSSKRDLLLHLSDFHGKRVR